MEENEDIEKMVCAISNNNDKAAKDLLTKVMKRKVADKLAHDLKLKK